MLFEKMGAHPTYVIEVEGTRFALWGPNAEKVAVLVTSTGRVEMMSNRRSGILLHLTSIPSRYGVGDLGHGAYQFADFLAEAGQRFWQILPLNPTSVLSGNSPYTSSSAFAGNPLLISPERLLGGGFPDACRS